MTLGDVVAVCAARLGDDAAAVLARIGGTLGDSARAASARMAGDRQRAGAAGIAADKQRRAEIMALARVPASPVALRDVHPSWVEAALAQLPERARAALSAARDATDVWLARRVSAELGLVTLEWMPREGGVRGWLRRIALEQLAFGLGATRATAVPALREAAARVAATPDGRGSQRAAIARCRDARPDDEASLVRVAARALAPHLVHEGYAIRAIARRLPRELGLVFEREVQAEIARVMRESSSETHDQVCSWPALVRA